MDKYKEFLNTDFSDQLVIDVHCHTFNASDIPVSGFIRDTALNDYNETIRKLAPPLVRFLSNILIELSPCADKENRKLIENFGKDLVFDETSEPEPIEDKYLNAVSREIKHLQHKKITSKFIGDSDDSGDIDLLDAINEEIYGRDSSVENKSIIETPLKGIIKRLIDYIKRILKSSKKIAKSLFESPGSFGRHVRWAYLLSKYRYEIIRELRSAYDGKDIAIDLFTPALVDFTYWVKDEPESSIPAQIILFDKIIQLFKGQIHPFVAYDPWREAERGDNPNGSLYWVKKAIEEHGFIGVKLYPPMGFSPRCNEFHDFSKLQDKDSSEFGKSLDHALAELFKWCNKEEVPIMAHCNDSHAPEKNFEERAHPKYWMGPLGNSPKHRKGILDKYPKLRVNLAHFGGEDDLSEAQNESWSWFIAKNTEKYKGRLFTDIGYFDGISKNSDALFNNLEGIVKKHETLKDSLMFGTDWHMIYREPDHENYFSDFTEGYFNQFGKDDTLKFIGSNAQSFLGLYPGEQSWERIKTFYKNRELEQPDWMKRIEEFANNKETK